MAHVRLSGLERPWPPLTSADLPTPALASAVGPNVGPAPPPTPHRTSPVCREIRHAAR